MMNEMGVSSHKGRYSGHLKLSRLAVVIFGVRRVRFVCDYLNGDVTLRIFDIFRI